MEKEEIKKLVFYGVVSGGVGLVYLGLLMVMDLLVGTSPVLSVTVAYASAMFVYFIISKLFIFKSTDRSQSGRELLQFGTVVTINYFLTQLIVQGIHALTGEVYSGSFIAGVVTISLSYIVFDRIVFKK